MQQHTLCTLPSLVDIHKQQSFHIHFTFADISVMNTPCFNSAHFPVLNQALCQY